MRKIAFVGCFEDGKRLFSSRERAEFYSGNSQVHFLCQSFLEVKRSEQLEDEERDKFLEALLLDASSEQSLRGEGSDADTRPEPSLWQSQGDGWRLPPPPRV